MLVQVHGSGANFAELPLRAIARALSPKGYAAMAISTRQHDEHVNTDNFFAVRQDIEAAVATAKALGYRRIVLEGHSLGTVQIEYYAATSWDPALKAVILTGPFGKLPWKSAQHHYRERGCLSRADGGGARGGEGWEGRGSPRSQNAVFRSAIASDGSAFPHLS